MYIYIYIQVPTAKFRTHPQIIVGTPICGNPFLRPQAELCRRHLDKNVTGHQEIMFFMIFLFLVGTTQGTQRALLDSNYYASKAQPDEIFITWYIRSHMKDATEGRAPATTQRAEGKAIRNKQSQSGEDLRQLVAFGTLLKKLI